MISDCVPAAVISALKAARSADLVLPGILAKALARAAATVGKAAESRTRAAEEVTQTHRRAGRDAASDCRQSQKGGDGKADGSAWRPAEACRLTPYATVSPIAARISRRRLETPKSYLRRGCRQACHDREHKNSSLLTGGVSRKRSLVRIACSQTPGRSSGQGGPGCCKLGARVSNQGQTCTATRERLAPSCENRLQLNSARDRNECGYVHEIRA